MEASAPPRIPPASERPEAAQAPTEPADYGVINAVYGTLLAGLVLAARDRAANGPPIPPAELLPLGVATFSLAKVVAKEKIGTWVREPFVEQDAEQKPERPRGRRLRHAVGELMTCSRCVGAWSSLGLVGLRIASPPAGRIVTSVLVTSAVNDFLQAGFSWITAEANAAGD